MLRAVASTPQGNGGGIPGVKSVGVLAQSGVLASVTNTLTLTTLATVSIPANAIGPNGSLRITARWSTTSNANGKTLQVAIGATPITSFSTSNNASYNDQLVLTCRASQQAQVGRAVGVATAFGGGGSTVDGVYAIDFSQAQSLTFRAQLTTLSDTVGIDSYTVEILNP